MLPMRCLAAMAAAAAAFAAAPARAGAQPCDPVPGGSTEAVLLRHYSASFAFAAIEQPQRVPGGLVTITLESSQIPGLDRSLETATTTCPARDQPLATELARWYVRPRIAVGLPFGLHLEGAWMPPVAVGDARTDLLHGALAWTGRLGTLAGSGVRLQLRGHATVGNVRAPISCPPSALRPDPGAACYGRSVSRDRFHPGASGAEVLLGVDASGYAYYLGVGATSLAPELRVDFTAQDGRRDRTVVRAARTWQYPVLFGGSLRFTDSFALLGQYAVVPGDLSILRLGIAWRPVAAR